MKFTVIETAKYEVEVEARAGESYAVVEARALAKHLESDFDSVSILSREIQGTLELDWGDAFDDDDADHEEREDWAAHQRYAQVLVGPSVSTGETVILAGMSHGIDAANEARLTGPGNTNPRTDRGPCEGHACSCTDPDTGCGW